MARVVGGSQRWVLVFRAPTVHSPAGPTAIFHREEFANLDDLRDQIFERTYRLGLDPSRHDGQHMARWISRKDHWNPSKKAGGPSPPDAAHYSYHAWSGAKGTFNIHAFRPDPQFTTKAKPMPIQFTIMVPMLYRPSMFGTVHTESIASIGSLNAKGIKNRMSRHRLEVVDKEAPNLDRWAHHLKHHDPKESVAHSFSAQTKPLKVTEHDTPGVWTILNMAMKES